MTSETWNKSLLSYKTRCTLYNLVIYYLKYYTILHSCMQRVQLT